MNATERLTPAEIAKMRADLDARPPEVSPPPGMPEWDVRRIMATLEGLQWERDEANATLERLSALFEAGWAVVRTYEADLTRIPKAEEALEAVNRARNRLMAACGWEERGQEALRRIRDARETTWKPGADLLRPTTHDMREAAAWGLGEREAAPWEEER